MMSPDSEAPHDLATPDLAVPDLATHDLAIHDLGGDGPTTLYAHATGFHGRCWSPVATRLPHLHNVAYDARGHGDTPVSADWANGAPLDWTVHGAVAAAMAASLQQDGPLLAVGHSMGGAALLMAALAAPGCFRGLVVYEPILMPAGAGPNVGQGNFLAAGARKRRESFSSFDEAIANYSSKPPLNVLVADAMEAYVRSGFFVGDDHRVHLKCRPDVEARTYEAGGNHATWERLGEIAVPVWVLSGVAQEGQPSARMEELASRIPGSRYVELNHLGHFGPMQAPAEIALIVAEASVTF